MAKLTRRERRPRQVVQVFCEMCLELSVSQMGIERGRRFVLGIGCERGAPADDVLLLATRVLEEAGLSFSDISALASIDSKVDEEAILAVASRFGLPLELFSAARLEQETPRLANPSARVFALIGCHGVAESAALAAAGGASVLVVPKRKSGFATAAVAEIL